MTQLYDTYQGWTNYETWCVNLWLTNDEGSAGQLHEIATTDDYGHQYQREDALKEWLEEMREDWQGHGNDAHMLSDLIQHALGMVNWREIIKATQEAAEEDLGTF